MLSWWFWGVCEKSGGLQAPSRGPALARLPPARPRLGAAARGRDKLRDSRVGDAVDVPEALGGARRGDKHGIIFPLGESGVSQLNSVGCSEIQTRNVGESSPRERQEPKGPAPSADSVNGFNRVAPKPTN